MVTRTGRDGSQHQASVHIAKLVVYSMVRDIHTFGGDKKRKEKAGREGYREGR